MSPFWQKIMNLEELEQIIRILKQNDVTEFELENDGVHIRLARGQKLVSVQNGSHASVSHVEPAISGFTPPAPAPSASTAAAPSSGADPYEGMIKVESPIVGTFYRRPSPDAEPYATEGKNVKKGDTLCIIEAMKIMNEIEAPVSGKIVKVMLSDSQVVEFGEVLFIIDPRV